MDELDDETVRERLIAPLVEEASELLRLPEKEPLDYALAVITARSESKDLAGWLSRENFQDLVDLAEEDHDAYRLACALAAGAMLKEGTGIPTAVRMFILGQLMQFGSPPPRRRGKNRLRTHS